MADHPPRRSSRRAGKLPHDINVVTTAARQQVYEDRFVEWQRSNKSLSAPDEPFRFLDLPAELRTRVLCFALLPASREEHDGAHEEQHLERELSRASSPLIAGVSRQLYHETVTAYLADSIWTVPVRSNIDVHYKPPAQLALQHRRAQMVARICSSEPRRPRPVRVHKDSGTVVVSANTAAWIERIGLAAACICNVNFDVFASTSTRADVDSCICQIQIRKVGASINVKRKANWPCTSGVSVAVKLLEDKIKTTVARGDFRGFTLDEVQALAAVFKLSAWSLPSLER